MPFLLTASGCMLNNHDPRQNSDKEKKVREISVAIEIVDSDFVFSDKSTFKLGEATYSFRKKAIYGKNGVVQKLIIYKPEGALEYNEDNILDDPALMIDSGLPTRQNWGLVNSVLADENGNFISRMKWVSGSIYKVTNERYTIFYKIE
jgi:hypothetical protein